MGVTHAELRSTKCRSALMVARNPNDTTQKGDWHTGKLFLMSEVPLYRERHTLAHKKLPPPIGPP